MTTSATSKDDFSLEASMPEGAVPLESILYTEELRRRPWRPPDYGKENRSLVALASAMADSKSNILQKLADTILEATECDSAGLSLLTKDDDGKRFYWPAIAGIWKPHIGGGTPRNFGPCGDVLDRNCTQLFRHFEHRYPYLVPVMPPAEECLLVPFYVGGKAVGTIWAIMHTDRRKFDAEDERLMSALGQFASLGFQTSASIDDLKVQIAAREKAETALRELAMYSVAHLLQMEEKSTTAMLQEIASLLPPAWQYPEVAAARVQLGETEFTTPNFRSTRWSQQAEYTVMDGRKGAVEVVYLEERLPEAEGPFLAEERRLLNGVAEGLKVYLDRKWLESEILEISDREQHRIGQDLHDGLSQHLRGIAYLSHVLQKDLTQESLPGAKDASRITQLLNKAILETHSLAQGLFPTALEADGLMSALKELASSIKTIYKISCRLMCPKPVLIDKGSVAMHLYRIAQEAVQNAIKHGKATRVVIRLTQTSEAVELAVKDNGKGLPKHSGKGKGMGLKIMDHRARMIGAELRVQRAVVGTLLTCSLRTRRDKFSESKICVPRNRVQSPKN